MMHCGHCTPPRIAYALCRRLACLLHCSLGWRHGGGGWGWCPRRGRLLPTALRLGAGRCWSVLVGAGRCLVGAAVLAAFTESACTLAFQGQDKLLSFLLPNI